MDYKEKLDVTERRLFRIVDLKLKEGSIRRQIKELESLRDEVGDSVKAVSTDGVGGGNSVSDPTAQKGTKLVTYSEKIEQLRERLEDIVMDRMMLEEVLCEAELSPNAREYARLRYVEGRRVGYIMAEMDYSASTCRRLRIEVVDTVSKMTA